MNFVLFLRYRIISVIRQKLGPGIETVLLSCDEHFLTTRGKVVFFSLRKHFLVIVLLAGVISANSKILRSLLFVYYHIV